MTKRALMIFIFFISGTSACFAIDEIKNKDNSTVAVLQGLNKVTGKTSELTIKIGEEDSFGKLNIKVKKCWRAPLDQRPENKILLEIEEDNSRQDSDNTSLENIDKKDNKPNKVIFYGWMFSSSPSISGLEHPIYDITAISCK